MLPLCACTPPPRLTHFVANLLHLKGTIQHDVMHGSPHTTSYALPFCALRILVCSCLCGNRAARETRLEKSTKHFNSILAVPVARGQKLIMDTGLVGLSCPYERAFVIPDCTATHMNTTVQCAKCVHRARARAEPICTVLVVAA